MIRLIDPTGRIMIEKRMSITQKKFEWSVDISEFESGIYFLKVTDGFGNSLSRKLFKI